jgi:hypothetical protein
MAIAVLGTTRAGPRDVIELVEALEDHVGDARRRKVGDLLRIEKGDVGQREAQHLRFLGRACGKRQSSRQQKPRARTKRIVMIESLSVERAGGDSPLDVLHHPLVRGRADAAEAPPELGFGHELRQIGRFRHQIGLARFPTSRAAASRARSPRTAWRPRRTVFPPGPLRDR